MARRHLAAEEAEELGHRPESELDSAVTSTRYSAALSEVGSAASSEGGCSAWEVDSAAMSVPYSARCFIQRRLLRLVLKQCTKRICTKTLRCPIKLFTYKRYHTKEIIKDTTYKTTEHALNVSTCD